MPLGGQVPKGEMMALTDRPLRRASRPLKAPGHKRSWPAPVRAAGLTAGAAALLAAAATTAQATPVRGPTGAASPIAVQLWESHNGGPVGGAMTALVGKFDASHPGVKVTIVVTKASTKLRAALPAGDAPVLAEISHYDGIYVKAGALVSWNSFLRDSSVVNAKNMLPAVWENGEVRGQHYRLQADLKVSEVFYNEALFKKAGITSAPATWPELATDAAKLKRLGVIPIGWKDSSAHILPAIMSNGGTLLRGSNSVGHAVDFETPATKATFTYFRSLYGANELQFHHGTTLREDLAAGKMAMIDGTSAGYAKVLDAVAGRFPVGAFVEPAGSTGHAANIAQGLGFVLPKGHTHAQDEAAWTFVQWWFEPAQQALWAERTGFDPETKAGIAAVPATYLATHPGLKASISAAESPYTVPRPVSDSYNEVQASIDAEFFDAVTGKQTVASALATLQKQGDSYMSGASEL